MVLIQVVIGVNWPLEFQIANRTFDSGNNTNPSHSLIPTSINCNLFPLLIVATTKITLQPDSSSNQLLDPLG